MVCKIIECSFLSASSICMLEIKNKILMTFSSLTLTTYALRSV